VLLSNHDNKRAAVHWVLAFPQQPCHAVFVPWSLRSTIPIFLVMKLLLFPLKPSKLLKAQNQKKVEPMF
jgi:hypothetical protein